MNEHTVEEQVRRFMEEKPYRIEQWENGTPSQQMLARAAKIMAGMEC